MSDSLEARTLGPYVLERRLGGGGMASVYRGRHQALEQTRAIKVMLPNLVGVCSAWQAAGMKIRRANEGLEDSEQDLTALAGGILPGVLRYARDTGFELRGGEIAARASL